jgi:protoheme IX farnesyltransferase
MIRAAHPEPAAAVTVVAGLLALAVGHGPGGTALVTATVAASQLATGWCNDAVDAARDAAVGRTGKPVAAGTLTRRRVAVAAGLAAGAAVLLAFGTGPLPAAIATLGLVSALAYNWPVKRTMFSPLPYAVSFAALPAFVVVAAGVRVPWWLVAAGGLLGTGAHFANVLPDLADDAATGVYGLPHRLGARGSAVVAAGLLLAATVVLVAGPPGPPSWVGMAALGVAAVALPAGWYAGSVFRAFLVVALLDVGLLLAGGAVL